MNGVFVSLGIRCYKYIGTRVFIFYSIFCSINTIQKIIGKLMLDANYASMYWEHFETQGLFRARKHNHLEGEINNKRVLKKLENENDFRSKPSKLVHKIGRCNCKYESLFYCSNELKTTVVEVRPKKGDYVSVASFVSIFEGKNNRHRVSPIGYRYLKEIPTLKRLMENMKIEERNKKFKKLDDFLDLMFHKKIKKVTRLNQHYYKLSTAVSKCFFTDMIDSRGGVYKQNGLIYSSIMRDKKSFNLVFKPYVIDTSYTIEYIQTFKILSFTEEKLVIKLCRVGTLSGKKTHPSENFKINWEYIENHNQEEKEFNLRLK